MVRQANLFIEIDLGLQHFLRRHDVDPPRQLARFQNRLGPVRRRRFHQFEGLLGEFRDRGRGLVTIAVDDLGAFRNRGAEFRDRIRIFLGPIARRGIEDDRLGPGQVGAVMRGDRAETGIGHSGDKRLRRQHHIDAT